jgi:putative glutamine amidotransferase
MFEPDGAAVRTAPLEKDARARRLTRQGASVLKFVSRGRIADVARPVVGITTYVAPARWSYWDAEAALVPAEYVRAVEGAGARPLLVPPSSEGVEETLDAVDGLIFSGGADLDPGLYGQEPHPETSGIHQERDRAELVLLEAALARDMPVLAICRGSQVLNVARGGDLVQHLPDVVGDEKHKHTPGTYADHDVTIEPGTRLGSLLGDHAPVKSHHHQGLGRIGDGLRPAARAEDGSVEAIESVDHRFAFGVLWHPEAGEDAKLFEELVREAGRYRSGRR